MQVTVKYFGMLTDITKVPEEAVNIDAGQSLADLLNVLSLRHGEQFKTLVMNERGEVQSGLVLGVLKANNLRAASVSTVLRNGDIIYFMPTMLSGG